MTNEVSTAVTDKMFVYQPLKQLTLEVLPIPLVLFKHWTLNYYASASNASMILNVQRVPMAYQ